MNTKIEVDAARIYDVLASGGLALARTNTGYGLVAMKSHAVRRIYALKGRPEQKSCVAVGTLPILDDVSGIDPETRAWLSKATSRWPVAVIAMTNRKSECSAASSRSSLPNAPRRTRSPRSSPSASSSHALRPSRARKDSSSSGRAPTSREPETTTPSTRSPTRFAAPSIWTVDMVPLRSRPKARFDNPRSYEGTFQREGVSFAQVEASWQLFLSERRSRGFGPTSAPRSLHGAQDAR